MRRSLWLLAFTLPTLALLALPAHRAAADDESDEVEVKIEAPLDAADCAATPPTITVLGLVIDVSTAQFGGEHGDSEGHDDGEDHDGDGEDHHGDGRHGDHDEGDDEGDADDGGGNPAVDCATLVVGQNVEVKLASDVAPLVATEVEAKGDQGGGDDEGENHHEDAEIKAPLQAVDAAAQTITLLGLDIDVGAAHLEGACDEDRDGDEQPIDLTQLVVGQFVEVELDGAQLPALVATQLEVKNFGNGIDVEIDDPDGEEADDCDVDVTETVKVRVPGTRGKVTQVLHFHARSNDGSLRLSGLPTGKAKITATSVAGGVTMARTRSVHVRGNVARSVRIKLRPVR